MQQHCRGNLARVRSGGTTVRSHVAHKYGPEMFFAGVRVELVA